MAIDFHGRGMAWPLRLSTKGGVAESANLKKIEEAILILLGTRHGERVMRPTYGCNLQSLVFAPNNASTAALARHYVQDGLTQWEPRIAVRNVTVTNDNTQGILLIEIRYQVKATLESGSLIYPFYLEQS